MPKLRNISLTAMLLFACTLSFAAPKNNFEGKTFVSTTFFIGENDVTSLFTMMGMKMELHFTASQFDMSMDVNGESETAHGTYRVDTDSNTLVLLEEENNEITCAFSADFSQLFITMNEDSMGDGNLLQLVLTEQSKAAALPAYTSVKPQEIDYGVVKRNIFAGRTYSLKKVELDGMDMTAMLQMAGDFDAKIRFDKKTAIMTMAIGDETQNETSEYSINYKTNTITFADDEGTTILYSNNGTVLVYSETVEDMDLDFIFEVE